MPLRHLLPRLVLTSPCANCEYACAGYRVETWDAAARAWNVAETSAARTKTFSGTSGAALVATALSDPNASAVAGSWAADGYTFGGKNHFALKGKVAFGQQLSAQFVMAYDHDSNIGSYPNIFGTTANTGRDDLIVYFDRSSGNVKNGLKLRPNFKLQNVTRRRRRSRRANTK